MTTPIYAPPLVHVTNEGIRSVAETSDLSQIDLANVFREAIMTLPSYSGLYHINLTAPPYSSLDARYLSHSLTGINVSA